MTDKNRTITLTEELAERLLSALEAGDLAGGDKRGQTRDIKTALRLARNI